MNGKEEKIRRESLYEQVWSTPMVRLAGEYGISDVGLAKICKKMSIPVPPRGFWRQKETGAEMPRPPLPPLRSGQKDFVLSRPAADEAEMKANSKVLDFEARPENKVMVALNSSDLDPEVERIRALLEKAKRDDSDLLCPPESKCSVLRVSRGSLDRASRILDALYQAFKLRGFVIDLDPEGKHPEVHANGGVVGFLLEETTVRKEKELTPAQLKDKAKHPWMYSYPQYYRQPTGILCLKITRPSRYTMRKSWTDGRHQRVENCLNKFLAAVACAAEAQKQWEIERQRDEEKRKARERLAERRRRRREAQRRYLWALYTDSICWEQSRQIRAFIHAFVEAAEKAAPGSTGEASTARWVAWANRQADRLDPLAQGARCVRQDRYDSPSYGEPPLENGLPARLVWQRMLRRSKGWEPPSDPFFFARGW